ncbi:hypothetical protein MSAN_00816800 [Mycena sanguinolenta]|uniref:Uncharacterized protein n=1 Tax=Mycena sanguinolenta TaxID=230812 RepID=A0A8H6YYY2_9AGAR|nr:hypothetical protein MSAN_00816800 [Mycena sanguinolenta]
MISRFTLPQELVNDVIDHLADDPYALQACSLASWAWVSRCRSYLFETCVLTPETIALFRDLLSSAECTFSSHIRKVKASRHSGRPGDHIFDDIALYMRGLQDIRELDIRMTLSGSPHHWDPYPYFCTGFITAFPHAARLDFAFTEDSTRSCYNHVTTPLFETISFFPALRELHITELYRRISDPPATRAPPRELHCLELREVSINPVLTWLNKSRHLPNVDSLTLSPVGHDEAAIVRAAMQRIGATLRHLDIEFHETEGLYKSRATYYFDLMTSIAVDQSSVQSLVFDLALHPNLETLIIRGDSEPSDDLQEFNPELLFRIVTSLVATPLEHLTLELDMLFYENLNWAALDAFLSRTRFPNLRRIVIKCTRHDKYHERDGHPDVYAALSEVFQVE